VDKRLLLEFAHVQCLGMKRYLGRELRVEQEPERADLYDVSVLYATSVLYSTPIDPGAVSAFQILDDESFALSENDAMIARDHCVDKAEIAFFMTTDCDLMAEKFLLYFLAVGSDYRELKHDYTRSVGGSFIG
jgi:hypothetical protein